MRRLLLALILPLLCLPVAFASPVPRSAPLTPPPPTGICTTAVHWSTMFAWRWALTDWNEGTFFTNVLGEYDNSTGDFCYKAEGYYHYIVSPPYCGPTYTIEDWLGWSQNGTLGCVGNYYLTTPVRSVSDGLVVTYTGRLNSYYFDHVSFTIP